MNTHHSSSGKQSRASGRKALSLTCTLALSAGIGFLAFAQAPPNPPPTPFESSVAENPKFEVVDLAFAPDKIPEPTRLELRDGLLILEGDIVISGDSSLKGLTDSAIQLWPRAEVRYVLPENFPNRPVVEQAIDAYRKNTRIKFVAIPKPEGNCIRFMTTTNPNVGGQSHLGMQKHGSDQQEGQELWMNVDTSKWSEGTVIHELAHALGIMHEQCRNDRDKYVEIVKQKIHPDYLSQFAQLQTGRDLREYDFESIMHYPPTAFALIKGTVTIKPRPAYADKTFGQRLRLSKLDIESLHELYAKELKN